jgi:uncharacterized membrane protein YagU involved in acid resistance
MRPLFGVLAGAAATVPMTAVIALGRMAFARWMAPPEQITSKVAERVGFNPNEESTEFELGWIAAHFGYGAGCGAVYSLVWALIPGSIVAKGLIFGELVWSVSYLGYIPAMGLYPWPKDDSKSRMAVMIAAHAVFGVATAHLERVLARINEEPECYVTIQPPMELASRKASSHIWPETC